MQPAISVRNLSKRYRLGTIGRQTLVDEVRYWLTRVRGHDPKEHFGKIGADPTEAHRFDLEKAGNKHFWALKDVSFDVEPGEVVGIIGKNGAGKSTILKILSRITEPTAGEVILNGRVGSLLEVGTGFHPELTGRENVYMNGAILGMKKAYINSKFDEIVDFSGLEKFIDTPVKRYSSGMYVRLAFAVAAYLEPEILVIDEVLAVGDAGFRKKCLGKMEDISKDGRTILFVSHDLPMISKLCNNSILLCDGKLAVYADTENVLSYYNKSSSDNMSYDLSSIQDRVGNGQIFLRKLQLFDEFQNEVSYAITAKKLTIRLIFSISDTTGIIRNVRFSVLIKNYTTNLILMDSSVVCEDVISISKSGFVDFILEKVPLDSGQYQFVFFVEADQAIVDWIKDGPTLNVETGRYYKTGKNSVKGWHGKHVLVDYIFRYYGDNV